MTLFDVVRGFPSMHIGLAADHGGFELKQQLAAMLRQAGHQITDFGAHELHATDDYPDFVIPLARAVATGQVERGIAVCGSGVGASIAANKVPGVRASVNYATEKAHVELPADVTIDDAIAVVEATGYKAFPPAPVVPEDEGQVRPAGPDDALRQRLVISTVLTVPVVLLAMVPALQFDYWQWASLTLAAPVAVWGALPFHRAAWANARHWAATMDTLVSLGIVAAFAWSLYALFLGGAGEPGMTCLLYTSDAADEL